MSKVSNIDAAYIAGFFDGDGCISRFLSRGKYPTFSITMGQKFPDVLEYIQSKLGFGKIYYRKDRNKFSLKIGTKSDKVKFIQIIISYSRIKHKKLKLVCSRFSIPIQDIKTKTSLQTDAAYIAGFFDAEGYIGSRITHTAGKAFRSRISITQNTVQVLTWIRRTIGVGKIQKPSTQNWYVYCISKQADIITFINYILPYSQTKKHQLLAGLELANLVINQNTLHSRDYDILQRGKLYSIIKGLKKVRPTRELLYMITAMLWAERSTCKRPNAKIGCMITDKSMMYTLAKGYNGPAKALPNNSCKNTVGSCECLHAEQNAITKVNGATLHKIMFITKQPCEVCARLIAQSNIDIVYFNEKYRKQDGIKYLKKCGIKVCHLPISFE